MYDRVLLATDGSDAARRATDHAAELARRHGAALHALYVVETRTAYDNAIVDPEEVRRNLREEGEAALAAVAEAAADLDVSTATRRGVPADEILAYAADHDVDLVVMGAQGRSSFKRTLLGSATSAVLGATTVPVLVVGDPAA